MKELTHTTKEFPEDRLGITWGRYNTFPTPFEELNLDEALLALHTDHMGVAKMYDNKQCSLPGTFTQHWNVTLHIWSSKVIAVAKLYGRTVKAEEEGPDIGKGLFVNSRPYRDGTPASHGYFMRFFRIGCDHLNLKELSQEEARKRGIRHYGMHDHYYECPDCGYTRRTDSSG